MVLSIQEARAKLEEKKKELNAIEKTYNDRLQVPIGVLRSPCL